MEKLGLGKGVCSLSALVRGVICCNFQVRDDFETFKQVFTHWGCMIFVL